MKKITDKQRVDYLQKLTNAGQYTGKVILRLSTTCRGWRLHETSNPKGFSDVREAIDYFIKRWWLLDKALEEK